MDFFISNPKLYLVDKLCGKPDWFNEQEYTVCALVGLALSHTGSHIYVYLQINLRLPLPYQNGNHMMYDSFLFQILQLDFYYSMQQEEFLSSSKLPSANTFLQASKHLL